MPNKNISDALKEVYATAPLSRIPLHTIELRHEDLPQSIYCVQDRIAHDFTLETAETVTFEPVPFRFLLPSVSEIGSASIQLAIDDIKNIVSSFIDSIRDSGKPLLVYYRPYLSDAPEAPQMNPPLVLTLSEIRSDAIEVSGKASFAPLLNMQHGNVFYNEQNFPGLSG